MTHPMTSPTHYCVACGARWRQNDDFSMSLRDQQCCDACNNTPVGGQLEPLDRATADVEVLVLDDAVWIDTGPYAFKLAYDAGDDGLEALEWYAARVRFALGAKPKRTSTRKEAK